VYPYGPNSTWWCVRAQRSGGKEANLTCDSRFIIYRSPYRAPPLSRCSGMNYYRTSGDIAASYDSVVCEWSQRVGDVVW